MKKLLFVRTYGMFCSLNWTKYSSTEARFQQFFLMHLFKQPIMLLFDNLYQRIHFDHFVLEE